MITRSVLMLAMVALLLNRTTGMDQSLKAPQGAEHLKRTADTMQPLIGTEKSFIAPKAAELNNIVGSHTQKWRVPLGYVDLNLVMTVVEMSDRLSLWRTDNHLRRTIAAGANGQKVIWQGCRSWNCAENDAREATINIPRTDK